MEERTLTRKDTYCVKRILNLRDDLRSLVFKTSNKNKFDGVWIDDEIWGTDLDTIVQGVAPAFAFALDANVSVVEQSLYSLLRKYGDPPSVEGVSQAAWVLAGNVDRLRFGDPVEPFISVVHEEWVPIYIIDRKVMMRYGLRMADYEYKVMAGTPAGCSFKMSFVSECAASELKRKLEIPRRTKISAISFVGLHAWVLLDPVKSQRSGRTEISHIGVSPSMRAENRDILKARRTPCIHGYDPVYVICEDCERGLISCYRAVHKNDYVTRLCPLCGHDAFFENVADNSCVVCKERSRIQLTKRRQVCQMS